MDIRTGIIETANALGISPEDLATIISYETGGTFDPTQAGPVTKWGRHRGLIQFGEPQAQQYGVDWNDPVGSQLGANGAIVRYLKGAGVQPGMGMLDVYSAVNAGRVGRYNATDAAAGGAPGTVSDKVDYQMAAHRAKAKGFLGNAGQAPAYSAGPGRGSMAGYHTPGTYSGGEFVPGEDKTFYADNSPALPQGGAGTAMGGFVGGPSQVAARSPEGVQVQSAGGPAPKPNAYQSMMTRSINKSTPANEAVQQIGQIMKPGNGPQMPKFNMPDIMRRAGGK